MRSPPRPESGCSLATQRGRVCYNHRQIHSLAGGIPMADLFISYSRKDQQFVRQLHVGLEEHGRDAWVDWENIPLTAEWLQEIYDGIEAANAFAYVISPDSVRSEVCSLELAHAIQHNKRLIPILHRDLVEDMDKKALDPHISSHNWIFFRETDDFDKSFTALMDALNTDLDYLRLHTRLLVRAVQWNDKERDASLVLRGNELREAVQWLDKSVEKQPAPTELHGDYIHASQRAAAGRRRVVALTTVYGLVVLVLALFAFWQAVTAENRRQEAEQQREIADDQRQIAELNAATAVAAEATAVFNGDQSHSIALAASAQQSIYRDDNPELALALALEAVNTSQPPPLASSALAQIAYFPATRYILEDGTRNLARISVAQTTQTGAWIAGSNEIVLTDLSTGAEKQRWPAPSELPLTSIAFSPDGSRLAVADKSAMITVFDVAGGTIEAQFGVFSENTDAWLSFTPDGQSIVDASGDGNVRVWNIADAAVSVTFEQETSFIYTAAVISPDGTTAVSGDYNGDIYWWDLATGALKATYNAGAGQVWSLAFMPDGQRILVGYDDSSIQMYDLVTQTEILRLREHTNIVWSIDVSADGQTAISGGYDNNIIFWDLNSGGVIRIFRGHNTTVYGVAFINNRQFFSGSVDGTLRVWDIINSAELARQPDFTGFYAPGGMQIFQTADGQPRLLAAGADNSLQIRDLATGSILTTFPVDVALGNVRAVAINSDQTQVAASTDGGTAILFAVADGSLLHTLTLPEQQFRGISFSPDGQLIALGAENDLTVLWDTGTGEIVREINNAGAQRTWSARFSPDGTRLVTADTSGNITLWDAATGERRLRLEGHSGAIYSAIFSADGSQILSSSQDRTIRLWDATTGNTIRVFVGHRADVNSARFSPDERQIASVSDDRTVRLWDIATGNELQRFEGHQDSPVAVGFAPDGHSLFSAGMDNSIRHWQLLTTDELVTWARANRYIPDFTCVQRDLYRIEPYCPPES